MTFDFFRWSTKNIGDKWHRVEVVLPNVTSKYFMQVEARKGMRIYSDVAIDDFSMSPECFGFNIPPEHLGNYNYWDPRIGIYKPPHIDFVDKKCKKQALLNFQKLTKPFFQSSSLQLVALVVSTAPHLKIAQKPTMERTFSVTFMSLKRRLTRVCRFGKFQAKDTTRKFRNCWMKLLSHSKIFPSSG